MANSNQGNQSKKTAGDGTSKRGFTSMDKDKQRAIAADGGRAAHASGNAHEFDSREASEAGSRSHGKTGGPGAQGNSSAASAASGKSGGSGGAGGGTRGGSNEKHAEAGRQSHKKT